MKRYTLLCFACLMSLMAQAQAVFEGGLLMGFPTQDFQRVSPNVIGLGLGGSLMYRPGFSALSFGINADYMIYGKDRQDQVIEFQNGTFEEGELIYNNNMVRIHGIARLQLPPENDFPILPYVEGLAGINLVYTNSKLTVDFQPEPLSKDTENFSATWSIGWAVGLNIRLGEFVYLDAKFKFLKTGQVDYITNEDVEFDDQNNSLIISTRQSALDMYIPQIGLTFFID